MSALGIAIGAGVLCALIVAAPVIEMADCLSTTLRQLSIATRVDLVSGALTRRAFYEAVSDPGIDGPAIVAIVDIDHFKWFNDNYGHATGDQVLRHVVDTLAATIPTSIVGRVGGDEFAIYASTATLADIEQRLTVALATIAIDDVEHAVSCTHGVATLAEHETIDVALERADRQLLARKRRRTGIDAATPRLRPGSTHGTDPVDSVRFAVALLTTATADLDQRTTARNELAFEMTRRSDTVDIAVAVAELAAVWARRVAASDHADPDVELRQLAATIATLP
jgi:diguanylate cyclase (GGDEF)-like protein